MAGIKDRGDVKCSNNTLNIYYKVYALRCWVKGPNGYGGGRF